MRRIATAFALSFLLLSSFVFYGCGSTKKGGGTCPGGEFSCGQLCDVPSPPAGCGDACDGSTPCPTGFYCSTDGTCTADCASAGDTFCPNGLCSVDGMCTEPPDPTGDAGPDSGSDPDACARQSVNANTVTPNVIFIVDRSGSMRWELDLANCDTGMNGMCGGSVCGNNAGAQGVDCNCDTSWNPDEQDCYTSGNEAYSRWRELRTALVGTSTGTAVEGLIGDLQDQVRFGAFSYRQSGSSCTSINNFTPVMESGSTYLGVVDTIAVPAAREVIAGNGADGQYLDRDPSGGTPTGAAIDWAVANIAPSLLASSEPTIFILATDGNPQDYSECTSQTYYNANAQTWSVEAVQRAYANADIRTFVLAVADTSQLDQPHVDQLANAGLGLAPTTTPAATSWRITSVADLNDALQTIIGGEISCTINLEGMVPSWSDGMSGCSTGGTVEFVGPPPSTTRMTVPCSSSNGWSLTGPSTMELNGTYCDTLKSTAGLELEASFPCGAVIIMPG